MPKTREWSAWINKMPPMPGEFHVRGEVEVGNPGVLAWLVPKVPQGTNPLILLLDLYLVQLPGIWIQQVTWTHARYDKLLKSKSDQYTDVEVFHDNKSIEKIHVTTIE